MGRLKKLTTGSALFISIGYILSGIGWIALSDYLVYMIWDDPELIARFQSLKGWFFVIVSGLIIYLLVSTNNSLLNETITKLGKNRDLYRATFEHAPVGIAHLNPDRKWLRVNQTLCDMLGYTKEEFMQCTIEDLLHPDYLEESLQLQKELLEGKRTNYKKEKRYRRKDGTYVSGIVSKSVVRDGRKNPVLLVLTVEDISEQKTTQKALQKSVHEKNVLLSEIHHRVRNNLALISAFFELQIMYSHYEGIAAIQKVQKRIKCLSLVHEAYAADGQSAYVNAGKYLKQLIKFVYKTEGSQHDRLKITHNLPAFRLNINQAVPAGLLCNELLLYLISEYAGEASGEHCTIHFDLQQSGDELCLQISNTLQNMGLKYELEADEKLEMMIVKTLASQLNGTIKVKQEKRLLIFELSFKKRNVKGPSSSMPDFKSDLLGQSPKMI